MQGERGSKDTARDVRGFAVKFYTDEGNWDLVGNNILVFFIQDAMKFPDQVYAAKSEPHDGMPQAASAHDTFWDFVSLMPKSTHMPGAVLALAQDGHAMECIRDQFRHCKPILVQGEASELLDLAGVTVAADLGAAASFVLAGEGQAQQAIAAFIAAMAKHRLCA